MTWLKYKWLIVKDRLLGDRWYRRRDTQVLEPTQVLDLIGVDPKTVAYGSVHVHHAPDTRRAFLIDYKVYVHGSALDAVREAEAGLAHG